MFKDLHTPTQQRVRLFGMGLSLLFFGVLAMKLVNTEEGGSVHALWYVLPAIAAGWAILAPNLIHEIPVPTEKELRLFGIVFMVVLGLLTGWDHLMVHLERSKELDWRGSTWYGIAPIGVVTFSAPQLLRPVHWGLTCLTQPIGWVISRTLLLSILVFVMAPVRLFMVVVGMDKMARRLDRKKDSYWVPAEYPVSNKEDYANLF